MNKILFQFHEGIIPKYRQDCLDNVRQSVPFGVEYRLLTKADCEKYPIDWSLGYQVATDVLRCFLLSENPLARWLDSDCMVADKTRWWVMGDQTGPYAGFIKVPGKLDSWDLYNNGDTEIFKEILEDFNKPEMIKKNHWLQILINGKYRTRFNIAPEGSVRHFYFGRFENCKNKNWTKIGFNTHSIINNNGEISVRF